MVSEAVFIRVIWSAKTGGSVGGGFLIKIGHVRSNNTGMQLVETNNEFRRVTFLFVLVEYVSKGIAQSEFWLKIRAVKHVVYTMQVASCQNSVLKGGGCSGLLLFL